MQHRDNIRIRDPFILTDPEAGCYYMYGSRYNTVGEPVSFLVYRSRDLIEFEDPKELIDPTTVCFTRDFWAPEVHRYHGRYYLFGSGASDDRHRGTMIFVSDSPEGPFLPLTGVPITPKDWECLDGTLWVENGTPYLIFCHEWTQIKDGEICALPLSEDLSRAVGEPFRLFRASDNPNVSELGEKGSGCYVTDGPFLYEENGKLRMIWSSFYKGRYLVLEAESNSLYRPWSHHGSRFDFDGGHAMLFTDLSGIRRISLHRPNMTPQERFFHTTY